MQKGPGTLRGHPTPSSVRRSRSARLAAHRALGSLLAVGTSEGLHHAVTGHPGGGDCGEDRDANRHDPSCQLCQTLQHDGLLSPSWRRRFLGRETKKPALGTIPRRALDAARPSAFYIDYGALTAFRLLKTSKLQRSSYFAFVYAYPPRSSGAIGRVFGDLSRAEKR